MQYVQIKNEFKKYIMQTHKMLSRFILGLMSFNSISEQAKLTYKNVKNSLTKSVTSHTL